MGGSNNYSGGGDYRQYYAPYVEDYHEDLLSRAKRRIDSAQNPYTDLEAPNPDNAVYGVGKAITDYPSVYSVFESEMVVTSGDEFSNFLTMKLSDANEVRGSVSTEVMDRTRLAESESNAKLRDIGAVHSTSFTHSKALVHSRAIRDINSRILKVKTGVFSEALELSLRRLKFKYTEVVSYLNLAALGEHLELQYVDGAIDLNNKRAIWPFTLLDFYRSYIGALRGAHPAPVVEYGGKTWKAALSWGITGAAVGYQIGSLVPGIGTLVGTIVGFIVGIAAGLLL